MHPVDQIVHGEDFLHFLPTFNRKVRVSGPTFFAPRISPLCFVCTWLTIFIWSRKVLVS